MSYFKQAKPAWPKGLETEKNIHAGFRAEFQWLENQPVALRVTGSTLYRIMLNGQFVHHGPARGPHGFFRVDELNLSDRVERGTNRLSIEVVGANCNSFAYPNQPSFCQAEISAAQALNRQAAGSDIEVLHRLAAYFTAETIVSVSSRLMVRPASYGLNVDDIPALHVASGQLDPEVIAELGRAFLAATDHNWEI